MHRMRLRLDHGVVLGICVLTLWTCGSAWAADPAGTITADIPVGEYKLAVTTRGDEIHLTDFGTRHVAGAPLLPSKIFAIAVPPGAKVTGVRYVLGDGVVLPGRYRIPPAPAPRPIGDPFIPQAQREEYAQTYAAVYGTDAPYPAAPVEFVRTAGYRKYDLVDVRVMPVVYRPQSQQLTYYPQITVHVDYVLPQRRPAPLLDNQVRPERTARDIVLNYEQAQGWYPRAAAAERGLHDFVIITLDSLTMPVAPLVEWETIKGRNVEVVTTSWIEANYTGVDLAQKMRNFLRDKYPTLAWGIEDVLLVGHYDDVPMRRVWQDQGYGKPETDYYYAELTAADEDSWDDDGDQKWCEDSDSIDFYNEVNVGRIPWSDPDTVFHICEKSVAYEMNEDPTFKHNILLLGGFYWADTDNAVLMEMKVDQLWMFGWWKTRMYEQYTGYYSSYECDYTLNHDNVMAVWPAGTYAFVNWAGHGSPQACYICGMGAPYFIHADDCAQLNDDYPAIIFAAACSNSDTDEFNIGQAMMAQGSIGFLGSTKVAYGFHDWDDPYDGSTTSMDYFFTTCVTSGQYTQGAGHQWALREMYENDLWYYPKYENAEWGALWGNPNLSMAPPPFMRILLPDGSPNYLTPYVENSFLVKVFEGSDEYVADSGLLHYRYDGGEWQTAPLTPLGDDLYEAVLPPAECGDTPEFFVSAEGVEAGYVTCPEEAPDSVFTATVATVTTLLVDDFETDQGWTVENVEIETGAWERGAPAGTGDRGDPLVDYDGSGQCFLTENTPGNYDVDGGPTRLISPPLDLHATSDPVLQYARWFTNDDEDEDRLDVELSDDDGATWVLVESVPHTGGWVARAIPIASYVSLTDQVRVRFSATDNPNNSITEAGVDALLVFDVACHGELIGDMNCDGLVDYDDIEPFITALGCEGGDPSCWEFACPWLNGDCDGDGNVTYADIDGFVEAIGSAP